MEGERATEAPAQEQGSAPYPHPHPHQGKGEEIHGVLEEFFGYDELNLTVLRELCER